MAKKKERSEVEYLRGLVREQKSTIRNLKKQLGLKDKQVKVFEEHIDTSDDEEVLERFEEEQKKMSCPECKGHLQVVSLGVREMHSCKCGYRKTIKRST